MEGDGRITAACSSIGLRDETPRNFRDKFCSPLKTKSRRIPTQESGAYRTEFVTSGYLLYATYPASFFPLPAQFKFHNEWKKKHTWDKVLPRVPDHEPCPTSRVS